MKELLETLDGWTADGVGMPAARSSSGRSAARRDRRARCSSCADRRADRGIRQRRLRRGRRGQRDRARARRRHSRVIRYGISDEEAWDVGLACGGTIDVLDRAGWCPRPSPSPAPGDRGRAVATILPADAPPSDVRAARAGRGSAAARRRSRSGPTGRWTARSGPREADAALCEPRPRTPSSGARRGRSTIGDRQVFVEAFPVRPRLVIVGARRGRPLARRVREGARVRGRRRRRPGVVRDAGAVPPDRVDRLVVGWPDEVADEIGLGRDDAVAVLTHDVKFDEPAIVEALRRGCRYVGAVGSRRPRATGGPAFARSA
mgnify:CR=1 FL=1